MTDPDNILEPAPETPRRSEATAHDVAVSAGVSRIMVSRAFNPDASIRQDKREHILKVAEGLGYHPDMAARSMVRGRSNLVAILLPSIARAWESQEIDALIQELQAQGLSPLIYHVSPPDIPAAALSQVRAYRPAMVIAFMDEIAPNELIPMFGNSPAIYPHYGETPPTPSDGPGVDRLHVDQYRGIRSAIRLLASAGRKRLVYVAGADHARPGRAKSANSDLDRLNALKTAVDAFDIEIVAQLDGEFEYDTARHAIVNHVRHGGKFDAVFAANDTSAFGVMDALRYDLGIPVPDECAVVGFDNIREAGWRAYDLTTVGISVETRVAALMRLVKARLANPGAPSRIETVTASLIVRSSV